MKAWWAVRALVIALVLLVLPAHLVVVAARVPEPYPALFMPGFPGVPVQDGTVTFDSPEIVAVSESGGTTSIAPEELLGVRLLPTALLKNAFSAGLDDRGEPLPSSMGTIERFLRPGADGRVPGRQTMRAYAPETRRWLRERVEQLLPDADVERVIIRWRTVTVSSSSPEGDRRTGKGPVRQIVEIDLGAET